MGRGKRRRSSLFPLPIVPSALLHKEAYTEERGKRPINAKHVVSIAIGSHIVDKEGASLIAEVKTIKGSVYTW